MAKPMHVVDAFCDAPFHGNQAAVCILDGPASEAWMQQVAAEMRHSETAFIEPQDDEGVWPLRWFTPAREVDLCGHATLSSAHTLWDAGLLPLDAPAKFSTRSGLLTCTRNEDGSISMDFPAPTEEPATPPAGLVEALGVSPVSVHEASNNNWVIELADADAVRNCTPDFLALRQVSDTHAFGITAPGDDGFDVITRYFAPAWGIDEDPATGSWQTNLAVHWAERRGPSTTTYQASARGAQLAAELKGDRVVVTGRGVTVLRGELDA